MSSEIEHNPGVVVSMGITESKVPMLRATTRWDYISRFLAVWKEYVRFQIYYGLLLILGIYLMFVQPILGALALSGAVYFYQLKEFRKERTLRSKRTVIIGH